MFLALLAALASAGGVRGARLHPLAQETHGDGSIVEPPPAAAQPNGRLAGPSSLLGNVATAASEWAPSRQPLVGGRSPAAPPGAIHAFVGGFPPPPTPEITSHHEIQVPAKWAAWFAKDDLFSPVGIQDEIAGKIRAKIARTGLGVSVEVQNMDSQTMRDVRMTELLSPLPGIVCHIDKTVGEDGRIWFLKEATGGPFLEHRFAEISGDVMKPSNELPFMPLGESLPLVVDLLQGVQTLQEQNVVHCDLTGPRAIAGKEPEFGGDRRRAVITQLGSSACVADERDDILGCGKFMDGRTVGSSLRLPPEPIGTPYNMWQVGLLLAKMCLGEYPTDTFVLSKIPEVNKNMMDMDVEGRRRIQDLIRREFSIENDEKFKAFQAKNPEAASLIVGMLEKDPAQRWMPCRALEHVSAVMHGYMMDVPSPLPPVSMPANLPGEDFPLFEPSTV